MESCDQAPQVTTHIKKRNTAIFVNSFKSKQFSFAGKYN
jgi:hypothetical protein